MMFQRNRRSGRLYLFLLAVAALLTLPGCSPFVPTSTGNLMQEYLQYSYSHDPRYIRRIYATYAIFGLLAGFALAILIFVVVYYIPFAHKMKKFGDADLPENAFRVCLAIAMGVAAMVFIIAAVF